MKISVLQSLIKRNSNEIASLERIVINNKAMIGYYKNSKIVYSEYYLQEERESLSKSRKKIKKLVAMQMELKQAIAQEIYEERYIKSMPEGSWEIDGVSFKIV